MSSDNPSVDPALTPMAVGAAEYGAPGPDTARLLVRCPDRPGIVAAVAQFLAEREANIVASDQYSSDPEGGSLFMRMSFHLPV